MTAIAPSVTIPGELLLEAIAHIDAVGSIATELNGGVETRLAESTSQLAAELVLHLYEPPDSDAEYLAHPVNVTRDCRESEIVAATLEGAA